MRMTDYIFNEKKYIEDMIEQGYVDTNAPMKTIRLLARYCHYVLGLNQDASYRYIISYMELNAMEFHEQRSMGRVKSCIRDAAKNGAWRNIDSVPIRESELNKILSLNDERQEKIAFVLLADVKFYAECSGQQRLASYMSISDTFRLARVPCPYKDRAFLLHFLYQDREDGSFAEREPNARGKNRFRIRHKLNFISYDENDPVVLELTENNYKELAFTYLNWKNGGYKECKSCGRLFKTKKEGNQLYCKKCSKKEEKNEYKEVYCVDCGEEVLINYKGNKTCRCEECQEKRDIELNRMASRERMRRYRELH